MKDLFNRLPDTTKRLLSTKNGLLGGIVAGAAVLLTIAVASAPEPNKKPAQATIWPVTTMNAVPQTISPELKLYGRIETPRQSSLKASVAAYVETVAVLEGDRVSAGDILVRLDPTDARLEVQRRRADLAEARSNVRSLTLKINENREILTHEKRLNDMLTAKVERYQTLREQQSISQETLNAVLREADQQAISLSRQQGLVDDADNQLARAKAQVHRTEALLQTAQTNLDRTLIRAPFSGRITAVKVSPGELVQPGTAIADLYDTSSLEVRAQIPTTSIDSIRRALAAERILTARVHDNGREIGAVLSRISGEVSPGRSSVDGLFTVESGTPLEIGRAVDITLRLPPVRDAIALPIQSLYGNNRIFLVENDHLKAVTVERVGERTDDLGRLNVIVRSKEIGNNASIVTSQLSMAVTGLQVKTASSGETSLDAETSLVTRHP